MSVETTDDEYQAVCARIDSALSSLERVNCARLHSALSSLERVKLGVDTSGNRFDTLAEEDEDEEEEEGEQDFTRPGKSSIDVAKRKRTPEECRFFSDKFNAYFQMRTGKKWEFVITPESAWYVSAFEANIKLCKVLMTLFDERPTIVDAFGGSGGDLAGFMFNLYPKEVFVSDSMFVHDPVVLSREGGIMEHNLRNMINMFHELNAVGPTGEAAPVFHAPRKLNSVDFMRSLPRGLNLHILYLDPIWSMPGETKEMDVDQLVGFLKQNVFDPMVSMEITPRCIVLKTRWRAKHLRKLLNVLGEDYYADYSVQAEPFRESQDPRGELLEKKGTFHWVVILHNALKPVEWEKSEGYKRLMIEGKDVIVRRKDFIRPNIPLYANRLKLGEIVEHEDGDNTLTIRAPKRPRREEHERDGGEPWKVVRKAVHGKNKKKGKK
jgi:hypothetical protein